MIAGMVQPPPTNPQPRTPRPVDYTAATRLVISAFVAVVAVVAIMVSNAARAPKMIPQPFGPPPGPLVSHAADTHPSPPKAAAPEPKWISAVGRIQAGVTVYFRTYPGQEPDAWFTVIDPYVEGADGPRMLVRYAATGDTEYIDRRATMTSPAAANGQLVLRRAGS